MPTYEYECAKCGTVTELFQSITAKPKRSLPCGKCKKSAPVRRLIGTGGGIVFKGSGFYTTDYRSESYKKAAESEKPSTESKMEHGAKKDDAGASNQSRERERPVGEKKPAEPPAASANTEKPKGKKPRKE